MKSYFTIAIIPYRLRAKVAFSTLAKLIFFMACGSTLDISVLTPCCGAVIFKDIKVIKRIVKHMLLSYSFEQFAWLACDIHDCHLM